MRYAKCSTVESHEIGQNMQAIRKRKGITQARLGVMLDTDQSVVSCLERGKIRFTPSWLVAIANVLEVSVGALRGGQEENE